MNSLLTVTAFADSYDLTVLETVKAELGIELSDTSQDSNLTRLIHETSAAISKICNRVFAEETVSEVFRNLGDRAWDGRIGERSYESIILRRRPISSITSVFEDDIEVDPSEYECDFESGILYKLTEDDFRTTWAGNKVTVTYVAGWLLLDDLPYDIERACLLWIKNFLAQAKKGDGTGDTSIRVEDVPGLMRKEYFSTSQMNSNSMSISPYNPPQEVMVLLSGYVEKAIK